MCQHHQCCLWFSCYCLWGWFKSLLQDICKHALESIEPKTATSDAQPEKSPTFDKTLVSSNFLSSSAIDLSFHSSVFYWFISPGLFDSQFSFICFLLLYFSWTIWFSFKFHAFSPTFPTSRVVLGSRDRATVSSSTVIPSCSQRTTLPDDSGPST